MTQIADENGTVLLRNVYDRGILVRQDFANGQTYAYRYINASGASYAESVDVTLPHGTTVPVELASLVPDAVKHPPQ
jgi:hypothetical protein